MKKIFTTAFILSAFAMIPSCAFTAQRFDTIPRSGMVPTTQDVAAVQSGVVAVSNRVNSIEAETNEWNAAYGWGNHATNEYAMGTALSYVSNAFFQAYRGVQESFVIVDDSIYYFYEISNEHPYYREPLEGRNVQFGGSGWVFRDENETVYTPISGAFGYFPPNGEYINGTNSLSIELFFDSLSAYTITVTNRTDALVGGFYTDGTNETVYIRRN